LKNIFVIYTTFDQSFENKSDISGALSKIKKLFSKMHHPCKIGIHIFVKSDS